MRDFIYKKTYQAYNYEKQSIVFWFIDLKRALEVHFFNFFPVDRGDRGAAVLKKKGRCQSYNWKINCAPFSVRPLRLLLLLPAPQGRDGRLFSVAGRAPPPCRPGGSTRMVDGAPFLWITFLFASLHYACFKGSGGQRNAPLF